jgi:hypothetical protein
VRSAVVVFDLDSTEPLSAAIPEPLPLAFTFIAVTCLLSLTHVWQPAKDRG